MTNQGPAKLIINDDWKKKDDAPPATAKPGAGGPTDSGLVVDSDWKQQAQAEKERLAAADRAKAEAKAAKGDAADGAAAGARGEKIDFQALLGTLATQALMYMGAFPDESGRAMVSLEHARFHIDLMAVLEEKTKGNLTKAESDELTAVMHELRMRFVDISQAVTKAAKDRTAKGAIGTGGIAGVPGGTIIGG